MNDLHYIARDMGRAAHHADGEGLYMDEYDEYEFPAQFRQRVQLAMDRWENGVSDLLTAASAMEAIADEISQRGITTVGFRDKGN